MSKVLIFAGGYTEDAHMASGETVPGRCRGIGCWRFSQGNLEPCSQPLYTVNPSHVLVHPHAPYLYAVNERKEVDGIPGSTVSAFEICDRTGTLRLLNRQATTGADACHLAFSPDYRHLVAANYSGGSVCVFPLEQDHSLGHAECVLRHRGSGVNPQRQEAPHPHQILFHPTEKLLYVSDLGRDRLCCYDSLGEKGWLQARPELDIETLPGQGCRHGVFSADGSRLYVMTEMACAVDVYDWNGGHAVLLQTISLIRPEQEGSCLGAAIRLHPDGKLLFASVRGSNMLASFRVLENGTLQLIEQIPSGGEIPRDFIVTPDGDWLLAGHQDSHTVCIFRIDRQTGTLHQTGCQHGIGSVTTLAFWDPEICF